MIRTGSITSSGRTGTSPRPPSAGASRWQNSGYPPPFGPNWPGLAVAAEPAAPVRGKWPGDIRNVLA
jgi:hypothetical protein